MCLPGTVEAVRESIDAEPPCEHQGKVSRRAILAGGGAAALAAVAPAQVLAQRPRRRGRARYQDLTHVFREGFPVYGGAEPSRETLVTIEKDGFYSQEWTFQEHSGTHMDAPGHFVAGGRFSPQIKPSELFVPAAVIDISKRAQKDPDAMVEPADIKAFERRHGRIPKGAMVFMYSGWETRVDDAAAFKNADSKGTFHFPGFGLDALNVLLDSRGITGIGVDTLSLDPGESTTFEVHTRLLKADRYGLENVANLKKIPPRGANVVVGVVPWEQGSGGPCRLLASF